MIRLDGSSVVTKSERNDTTNLVEMTVGIIMDPPNRCESHKMLLLLGTGGRIKTCEFLLTGQKGCEKDASPKVPERGCRASPATTRRRL